MSLRTATIPFAQTREVLVDDVDHIFEFHPAAASASLRLLCGEFVSLGVFDSGIDQFEAEPVVGG